MTHKTSSAAAVPMHPAQGPSPRRPVHPPPQKHPDVRPPDKHHHPSTHAEADAARAMDHTNSWTPSLDRRQSWSKEDQKRACQMPAMDGVKTGPGFTEKRS